MRKKILLLTLFMCVASGCGSKSNNEISPADNKKEDAVVETQDNDSKPSTTVTKENFMSFPVTDESLFVGDVTSEGFVITGCSSEDDVLVIPETIQGSTVVSINDYALSNKSYVAIVLPDTVVTIGEAAFHGDEKLEYIYLGNRLKEIGKHAFNFCPELSEIIFPTSLVKIDNAIYSCDSLEKIYIPESVTEFHDFIADACPKATFYTPAGSQADIFLRENEKHSRGIPIVNE